jgi:hypothetical protein
MSIGPCTFDGMNVMKCSKVQYCAYCNLLAAVEETQHLLREVLSRLNNG